jgi:hypothetical protein
MPAAHDTHCHNCKANANSVSSRHCSVMPQVAKKMHCHKANAQLMPSGYCSIMPAGPLYATRPMPTQCLPAVAQPCLKWLIRCIAIRPMSSQCPQATARLCPHAHTMHCHKVNANPVPSRHCSNMPQVARKCMAISVMPS